MPFLANASDANEDSFPFSGLCPNDYRRVNLTLSNGTFRFPETGSTYSHSYSNCVRQMWNISHAPAFADRVRFISSVLCIGALVLYAFSSEPFELKF